jgi:hypothetical protein
MSEQKHKFLYTEEGKRWLEENYVNGPYSAKDIVAQFQLAYPNIVYRALKHHGFARKNKSEAQSSWLEKNPEKHPTAGKEQSVAVKKKIGSAVHESWHQLSPEIVQSRIDRSREQWYNIPEDKRKKMLENAHIALRETAKSGSKFEKYLLSALISKQYKVQPHRKFLFPNSEMSVDCYLPIERICIEINGVSHYQPVWGEEAFEKTKARDMLKVQQLLGENCSVIVINNEQSYHSKTIMEKTANALLKLIPQIVNQNIHVELVVADIL